MSGPVDEGGVRGVVLASALVSPGGSLRAPGPIGPRTPVRQADVRDVEFAGPGSRDRSRRALHSLLLSSAARREIYPCALVQCGCVLRHLSTTSLTSTFWSAEP